MALTPRDYATALYLAARGQDEAAAAATVRRFTSKLRARGLGALLPRVLKALPAVAAAAEGRPTVIVEAARKPARADLERVIAALGLDPAEVDIEQRTAPATLGGLRVRTADRVLDATAARRLADLGRALGATVSER